MNNRPRVFVIHEPLRRDPRTGDMVPKYSVASAAEFGDILFVLPSGNRPPLDPEATLPAIRQAMENFTDRDYLLLGGDMDLVAWAAALAARASDGFLTFLRWDNREMRYVARRAQLWEPNFDFQQPETESQR